MAHNKNHHRLKRLKALGLLGIFSVASVNGQTFLFDDDFYEPDSNILTLISNSDIPAEFRIRDSKLTDLDSDGDLDAFAISFRNGNHEPGQSYPGIAKLYYLENIDNDSVSFHDLFDYGSMPDYVFSMRLLESIDNDSDGDLDFFVSIIYQSSSNELNVIYLENQSGQIDVFDLFRPVVVRDSSSGFIEIPQQMIDLDEDLRPDLISFYYDLEMDPIPAFGAHIQVRWNDGSGSPFPFSSPEPDPFQLTDLLSLLPQPPSYEMAWASEGLQFLDLDEDGDHDLLISSMVVDSLHYSSYSPSRSGRGHVQISYLENTGSVSFPVLSGSLQHIADFRPWTVHDNSSYSILAELHDVDGDSDLDLVVNETYSVSNCGYCFSQSNYMLFYENLAPVISGIPLKIPMELECYPNPSPSIIHIRFENNLKSANLIEVFDMAGRKIFGTFTTGSEYYLKRSDIGSGIYNICVSDDKRRGTRKVVFLN